MKTYLEMMEISLSSLGFSKEPQADDYSILFTRFFGDDVVLEFRFHDLDPRDEYIVLDMKSRTSLSQVYKGHEADIMVVVERFIDVLVSYISKTQEGEKKND